MRWPIVLLLCLAGAANGQMEKRHLALYRLQAFLKRAPTIGARWEGSSCEISAASVACFRLPRVPRRRAEGRWSSSVVLTRDRVQEERCRAAAHDQVGEHVDFVVLYTREPHARQLAFKDVHQPATWEERRELAKKTKRELKLGATFLVDEMGDPSRKLFGDIPNPAILVGADGKVIQKLAWADASELAKLVTKHFPAPAKSTKKG